MESLSTAWRHFIERARSGDIVAVRSIPGGVSCLLLFLVFSLVSSVARRRLVVGLLSVPSGAWNYESLDNQ